MSVLKRKVIAAEEDAKMVEAGLLSCGCVAPAREAGRARLPPWRVAAMELRNIGAAYLHPANPPPKLPKLPLFKILFQRGCISLIPGRRSRSQILVKSPAHKHYLQHVPEQLRQRFGDLLASGSYLPSRVCARGRQAGFSRGGNRFQDTRCPRGDQGTCLTSPCGYAIRC